MTGVQPSLLLHPLDFLSGEDVPELKFFPGMNLQIEEKLEFVSEVLENFDKGFEIIDMRRHAKLVSDGNLREVRVKLAGQVQK